MHTIDAMDIIHMHDVPTDRSLTYASFVCDWHPLKFEKDRNQCFVGIDRLTYQDGSGSPATNIFESIFLINIVISHEKHGAYSLRYGIKVLF